MVLRVTYVMVGNEAPSYFVKMLHGIHIYFKHNRIVPQGLLYIYVYIYIYIYIYTYTLVKQWKGCLWKPQPWWELPDLQQCCVSYVG